MLVKLVEQAAITLLTLTHPESPMRGDADATFIQIPAFLKFTEHRGLGYLQRAFECCLPLLPLTWEDRTINVG